jgi:hypothetical protein
MGSYRLLAGQHVQADKTQKPVKMKVAGTEDVIERYPTRTYKVGDVVDSDIDLAARFGADHFAPVGGQQASDARKIADLERQVSELRAKAQAKQPGAAFSVPGDPTQEIAATSPSVAPGGQVSTGHQQTSGGVPGQPAISGPMSPADLERMTERAEARGEGEAGSKGTAKGAGRSRSTKSDDQLHGMTVEQLHEYAAEEEINLHGATKKDEIVRAIQRAQKRG